MCDLHDDLAAFIVNRVGQPLPGCDMGVGINPRCSFVAAAVVRRMHAFGDHQAAFGCALTIVFDHHRAWAVVFSGA
jgi:hypothetical protein